MTGAGKGWRAGHRDPVTAEEERTILAALRAGRPAYRIAAEVNRAVGVVTRIRDENGIPALGVGNMSRIGNTTPKPVAGDDAEYDTCQVADPWIAPPGIAWIERPNGRQWQRMLAAAGGVERVVLRHCMCTVHGIPLGSSDASLEAAVRADRRLAEELAGMYIAARGRMR